MPPWQPNLLDGYDLMDVYDLTEKQVFEIRGYVGFSGRPRGLENSTLPIPALKCLLDSFSRSSAIPVDKLWEALHYCFPTSHLASEEVKHHGLGTECLVALAYHYRVQVKLVGDIPPGHPEVLGLREPSPRSCCAADVLLIRYQPGHWSPSGTVPRAPNQEQRIKTTKAKFDPLPIGSKRHVKVLDPFAQYLSGFVSSKNVKAIGPWQWYKTYPRRGKPYARDLKNGTTGTITKQEGGKFPKGFTESMDSLLDSARPRKVLVTFTNGGAGCAKSSPFYEALQNKNFLIGNHWTVSVPRIGQRQNWADKLDLGPQSYKVSTFETALLRSSRVLIVDEVSQMPSGYVDYFLAKNADISHVVLLGDVTQVKFHEPNNDCTINSLIGEARWFRNFSEAFKYWSHRIPKATSNITGLPTTSKVEGFVKRRNRIDANLPLLVPSTATNRKMSDVGISGKTFSGAQGDDVKRPVQILIDDAAARFVDDATLVSALHRSSIGIYVIVTAHGEALNQCKNHPILGPLVHGMPPRNNYLHMFRHELGNLKIERHPDAWERMPTVVGGRAAAEISYSEDVVIPVERAPDSLIALLRSTDGPLPLRCQEPADFEPGPPTNLPVEDMDHVLYSLGELTPRESREVYDGIDYSNQFNDLPSYDSRDGIYYEQYFPKQSDKDVVTKRAAVKKRLRFASRSDNEADLASKSWMGPLLLDSLLKLHEDDRDSVPFDPLLYESCIRENEFVKLSQKSQAVLTNNADRSDADWKRNYVQIFTKGQLKTKMETLHSPFKAGQTIASFHDAIILVTGPMTRYLVHKLLGDCPKHVYYHSGRGPRELSTWAQTHWKKRKRNTTNDYTAFDQSQTGETLALERSLLRFYSFPEEIIDFYIEIKKSLECQYGHLAIARFTGEGPTWLFNSTFNAAIANLQYELERKQAIAISGDDLAINGEPRTRPIWLNVSPFLTLKAKTQHQPEAEFCSWMLSQHGAVKNPVVVLVKLRIAQDRGEAHLVEASYASEVAVGYRLGDHIYDILNEQQLAAHSVLVRYFVTKLPLRFSLMFSWRDAAEILRDIPDQPLDVLRGLASELWMLNANTLRQVSGALTKHSHIRGLVKSPLIF